RRFSEGARKHPPVLMDALSQYFKLYNRTCWTNLCVDAGFADENAANTEINQYFTRFASQSRHNAVTQTIGLFIRFSEENLQPAKCKTSDATLTRLLQMYQLYLDDLNVHPLIKQVDFSLLQKLAYDQISSIEASASVY